MLQRVFLFLLIFLIMPDLFLFFRFIIRITRKRWLRIAYWIPTFLLATGLLCLVGFANYGFIQRSEEHTSELQSANISYAVFCLKKNKLALDRWSPPPTRRLDLVAEQLEPALPLTHPAHLRMQLQPERLAHQPVSHGQRSFVHPPG